jgi:hypothetical protein
MSSARSGKSRALAWTLSMLAAPVLYLLSVPPITCLCVRAWGAQVMDSNALQRYIAPFNWVKNYTLLDRPLNLYRDWWYRYWP